MAVNNYLLTDVTDGFIVATMLKKDAVKYYGSEAQLAKALNIHRSAVLRWGGRIPMLRAAQLEQMTAGRLKYDQGVYLERK